MIATTMTFNVHPMHFLKQFFVSPKTVGAVAPTSQVTAAMMARPISSSATVLEIGAGTGAITSEVLQRISNSSQLTAVEIDPKLAAILRKNFPTLDIQIEDVELSLQKEIAYDVIISGIPFVSMDKKKRDRIFKLIQQRLKTNGLFIAFQYSLYTKKELEHTFSKVDIQFSPQNLPPAFIYICQK